MDGKRVRLGLCWFGAAVLAVVAFILVLAGIHASAGMHWTSTGLVLLILAGATLIAMIGLIVLAFRMERRNEAGR